MTTDTTTARGAFFDVKVGQTLTLKLGGVDSEEITLTLHQKYGQVARVQVQAPESVRIQRPAKRTG